MLWAVGRLETWIGTTEGALIASIGAIVLAVVAVWVGWLPQQRATVALAVAIVAQSGCGRRRDIVGGRRQHVRPERTSGRRSLGRSTPASVTSPSSACPETTPAPASRGALEQLDRECRTPARREAFRSGRRVRGPCERGRLAGHAGRTCERAGTRRPGGHVDVVVRRAPRTQTTVGTNAAAFDLWAPTGSGALMSPRRRSGCDADNWLMRIGWITVWPCRRPATSQPPRRPSGSRALQPTRSTSPATRTRRSRCTRRRRGRSRS